MKILCFFAHPDDETMLCGGTLALLHNLGAQIHYLCATRGEGGESGDPALCSQEELGTLRSQELRCAIDALGGGKLDFLPYVDPRVGPEDTLYPFTENINELVSIIGDILETEQPDAIITHGSNGEYGHPAHILCHQVMKQAFERLNSVKPLFYTFQAAYPNHPKPRIMNQDDSAHLLINVENVLNQKITATLCHRTQHALFIRRPSLAAGHPVTIPEIVLSFESLHRVYPTVKDNLFDPLVDLIKQSGAVD